MAMGLEEMCVNRRKNSVAKVRQRSKLKKTVIHCNTYIFLSFCNGRYSIKARKCYRNSATALFRSISTGCANVAILSRSVVEVVAQGLSQEHSYCVQKWKSQAIL